MSAAALLVAPVVAVTQQAAGAADSAPSTQSTCVGGAQQASTGLELRNEWACPATTSITLTKDIDLSDGFSAQNCDQTGYINEPLRDSSTNIVVDGVGTFGITQTCPDQRVLRSEGSGTVALQNLTHFTGGNAIGNGGGLLAFSPVTVTDSNISGNHATFNVCDVGPNCQGSGNGGGIYVGFVGINAAIVQSLDLTLTDATIANNTAEDSGGGVFAVGVITSSGSTFTDNMAGDNSGNFFAGCSGGGAYAVGSLTDTGSMFSGNETGGQCGGCAALGGGAYSGGAVSLTDSTFSANTAACDGECGGDRGGVYAGVGWADSLAIKGVQAKGEVHAAVPVDPSTISINQSTFAGNTASCPGACDGSGGGLAATAPLSMDVVASTFSDNSATFDGGAFDVFNSPGSLDVKVTNSTITGNQSGVDGAIDVSNSYQDSTMSLTLAYDTIVGKVTVPVSASSQRAEASGVVHAAETAEPAQLSINGGTLTVFGTILALPSGGPNCRIDEGTTLASQGYNWSDDTSCELANATDKVTTPNDPGLNVLGDWGGPTSTMLPLTPLHGGTTSSVIDAIPVAACQTGVAAGITTDQRGVTRPQLLGCDIGAVEVTLADLQVEAATVIQPKFTG